MLKNKTLRNILIVMMVVFGVTFYFGIFANPKFNIYDFCMNLSSEILGLVIAVVIVDTYIAKKTESKKQKKKDESDETV